MSEDLTHARELLEELASEPLELAGGYPAIVFGGIRDCTVIVSASPSGEPSVEMIADAVLKRWFERAAAYKEEHPGDSWMTAMRETEAADRAPDDARRKGR